MQTPRLNEVLLNDPAALAEAIAAGADVNRPFLLSAYDPDASPDASCEMLPLFYAVKKGLEESVEALLAAGANCSSLPPLHKTPMTEAIRLQDIDSVKRLIEADPSCIYQRDYDGVTPLFEACDRHDNDIGQCLIDAGADVNRPSLSSLDTRRTPLHAAASCRYPREGIDALSVRLVQRLLAAGADINAIDDAETTPLHAACNGPFPMPGVARVLLEAGADVNAIDDAETTPLHELARCQSNRCEEAVASTLELLIEYGADVNAVDNEEFMPIERAQDEGNGVFIAAYEALQRRYGVEVASSEMESATVSPGPSL